MAQIVLDIPTDQAARVVDAMCRFGGYRGDPDDQPARRAFVKQLLIKHVRETVARVEQADAMTAAMETVTPAQPVDIT